MSNKSILFFRLLTPQTPSKNETKNLIKNVFLREENEKKKKKDGECSSSTAHFLLMRMMIAAPPKRQPKSTAFLR